MSNAPAESFTASTNFEIDEAIVDGNPRHRPRLARSPGVHARVLEAGRVAVDEVNAALPRLCCPSPLAGEGRARYSETGVRGTVDLEIRAQVSESAPPLTPRERKRPRSSALSPAGERGEKIHSAHTAALDFSHFFVSISEKSGNISAFVIYGDAPCRSDAGPSRSLP